MENLLGENSVLSELGGWITQVFLVVFVTLVFDFLQKRMMVRIGKKVAQTRNLWDDAVLEAIKLPLTVLVWVVGLAFAANIIEHSTDAAIFTAIAPLRDVGVIFVIAWFLMRFIRNAEKNIIERSEHARKFKRSDVTAEVIGAPEKAAEHKQVGAKEESISEADQNADDLMEIDPTTVHAVAKLLRLSVMITAGLVMLQTLGYSISGVLAFGGLGGVVVGFAAKDLLANFFGGLMIYLDRPFAVGDWVRSPDRNIEGVVEHIGWRQTCIRTFDKRPLYIPNSVFANIAVENPQRMTHRRIYETIGIRYCDADKMSKITDDVRAMLIAHPEIDNTQTLMVNFNSFAPSSLDFFIYTFTKTTVWTEFHEIKHDVLLKINDIIASHKAEVAFPTSTVHVPAPVVLAQEESGAADLGQPIR